MSAVAEAMHDSNMGHAHALIDVVLRKALAGHATGTQQMLACCSFAAEAVAGHAMAG